MHFSRFLEHFLQGPAAEGGAAECLHMQIRQAEADDRSPITLCTPAECGELKTPTAGHRRTPIQFASALAAEAEAGTNAGTLERQNLRSCKTCISA